MKQLLCERAELLSSKIKAVLQKNEKLEERVSEKRVKVKEKMDSVTMLKNVLEIKKEEVAGLRRRVVGSVRHPFEQLADEEVAGLRRRVIGSVRHPSEQLAERAELLSSKSKAVLLKGDNLEKRVRENCVKIKEKRDSIIMLNKLLEIKKEEVVSLRSRVVGLVRHPPEPCHRERITWQQPAWESSHPLRLGTLTPHASRPGASGRYYSCHEFGHYARDPAGRQQASKPVMTRSKEANYSVQKKRDCGQ